MSRRRYLGPVLTTPWLYEEQKVSCETCDGVGVFLVNEETGEDEECPDCDGYGELIDSYCRRWTAKDKEIVVN